MKKCFFCAFYLLGCILVLGAQNNTGLQSEVRILSAMPNVEVIQDSSITQLMYDKQEGIVRGMVEIQGYRVQVYSSNQQAQAKAEALALEQELKTQVSVPVYVIYTTPFWKVRLGDFRTQEEALEYKKEFLALFPEMSVETYVVRDKIQVKQ